MNNQFVQRASVLACTALMWTACFSASTPKDPASLASQETVSDGLFVLDAATPPEPGTSPEPIDTYVGPADVALEDTVSTDSSSPPDIVIPDFGSGEDINDPVDAPPTEDTSFIDTFVPDAATEDTESDTADEPDVNTEDSASDDGSPPCEGPLCPGALAPSWKIEDFQPESPWFKQTYGLEKFQGKVTVMVLLAGW